jgi:hypothetical protein
MTESTPYEDGQRLAALFGHFEHVLKRTGFLKGRRHAEADWTRFAASLGEAFFGEVRQRGIAETLVLEPPRTLMADGLRWEPEWPDALEGVVELFVKGVCKARNSYVHGEKFVSSDRTFERDARLVREALLVLELAEPKLRTVD